jgi:hypothetical protein
MLRIFWAALVYSALIELESAYFKGAIATLAYGRLYWWPLVVTAITVFGFAVTIAHLIKRLERIAIPPGAHRVAIVVAAAVVTLFVSALLKLDENGVLSAQRHAGITQQ